jgi:ABC-type molybdate transport system permease subunit
MRSYWQNARLGWTVTATMFAAAIVELPLPVSKLRAVQKGRGSTLPG